MGSESDSSTFANELDALKRAGSTVLVVGTGTASSHERACERLLGDDGSDDRCRLFVATEGAEHAYLDEFGEGTGATRLITRSESELADGHADVDASVVGTELLSNLASEMIETINEFESRADGLRPSQLRVCLDSLAPLLTGHDSENVFRLVHMTTSRIRQVDGMGHYHLPVGREHDATRLLEPLFDAVVEVRADGDDAQQRWHLRDQRTPSEWIPL